MPPRDVRMYLTDILESADRILRLTSGKTLEQYLADENLRLIVERSFEIIGEALRKAIDMDPALQQTIPYARRIIDFRNVLIHAYQGIDHTIVGDITESYLPTLRRYRESAIAR